MEIDKKTGFVKRPTFAELAQVQQKVTHGKPIVRDALTYWNSYDSAWLKGPMDEVADRAVLLQNRQAIQQRAIAGSAATDIPVAHIQGSADRALKKPHRLESETVETIRDGIGSNYANPAQPNNVRESQDLKRTAEAVEELVQEMRREARMRRAKEAFGAGLGGHRGRHPR